ncbi:MAG TPA: hypothetical protein VFS32_12805 [Candidatus Limnocylindrales bacterium]|nr:hypothetical protein [Candidatus Limnocylindrales bacterium]
MTPVRPVLEPIVVALGRVDLWSAALAGFLVRGGVLLFLLPIVWLPSPLDLANLFGSAVTSAALGGPNPDLVRLVVLAAVATGLLLVVAFWLGALMDVAVVRIGARSLGSPADAAEALDPGADAPGLGEARTAFAARLLAFAPLGVALAVAAPAVVAATYGELVDPSTLTVPLVLRVLGDLPFIVALLLGTWLIGDAIGGLAVRRAVLDGRGAVSALGAAIGLVARRPLAALATLVAGTAVIVALVAPALLASAVVWRAVLFASRGDAGPVLSGLGIVALAALWLGGLVLAGFATAVRALLWSAFATPR